MNIKKGDLYIKDDRIVTYYIYILSHRKNLNDPYDNGHNKVLVYYGTSLYTNNYADTMLNGCKKSDKNINDIIKNADRKHLYKAIKDIFQ